MMRVLSFALSLILTLSLTGILAACTTQTQSNPARTATEQALISAAGERAAAKLALQIPAGKKIFVDAANFEGTDSKYAISAVRDSLLKQGAHFVDDKKNADTVIEIRAGALSIDKNEFLIGIPSFTLPIPLAGSPATIPEIALFKSADQEGLAKFAFTAYSLKDGALMQSQEPEFGFSHNTDHTILFFISWSSNDAMPDDDDDNKVNKDKDGK